MKTLKNQIKEIKSVIKNNHFVSDRENELHKLGYYVDEKPMGSGGTGQVKEMSDHYRIQIGYGHGKHNYAKCVIINK